MSSSSLPQLREFLRRERSAILHDFLELLKIPSISTDPNYRADVLRAHDFLVDYLKRVGFSVESVSTPRYPVIFATMQVNPDLPTIMIYNHYDVQPVDPLALWTHPPFTPYVDEKEEIFARGAQDNKGQLWGVLQGVRALLSQGKLPCNVTLCIEGEEESASVGIQAILPTIHDKLRADALFVVDVDMPSMDKPCVTLGIRGNLSMTFELTGSRSDLHSGLQGGIVYNPNHAMVEILSQLRDLKTGRILIEGFYDDIDMPTDAERAFLDLSFDDEAYYKMHGARPLGGEKEFLPLESCWLRPTLEINGLSGGYAGEGFKTVIPSKTVAKISCRIVPKQDPKRVAELVKNRLLQLVPEGLEGKVTIHGYGDWARVNPQGAALRSVRCALEEVLNKRCVGVLSGASIPVTASLAKAGGSDIVFFGLGLSDDNIHAPNEHYGLSRIMDLACIIARSIELFAK